MRINRTEEFIENNIQTNNHLEQVSPVQSNLSHSDNNIIQKEKIVLVGNPNVGKSIFFNHLSGFYVDVSNFPGTTVSITKGNYKKYEIYDTPGIYGVSSFNDEEKVARDVILNADIILNVVNTLYLERDLFLTLQLIEMGKKISVILNFTDEISKRKIKIDVKKLSDLLGVEVIETSAVKKLGFEKLDFAIEKARVGHQTDEVLNILKNYNEKVSSQAESLLIAEGDEIISEKYKLLPGSPDEREIIYVGRRNRVNEIVSTVEFEDSTKGRFFNRLGQLSLNPITALPIMAVVLVLLYFFIGDLVAQRLVNFTENTIGKNIFEYNLKSFVANFTPVNITIKHLDENGNKINERFFNFNGNLKNDNLYNEFINSSKQKNTEVNFYFPNPIVRLFFGEFGVITMTITYLLFLLLPLVISFYFGMAILEDSGYLPRLATMMDRSLTKLGLNGKAIIPIILGFGCVTMATITTRMLGTEREKTIATAILQFVIPCSAQLAVIAVLISYAGIIPLTIYVFVIFSVLVIISTILNKSLSGQSSPLLIDLPIMGIPKINNLLKKTYYRTLGFMKEATLWFFIGAFIVGLMDITNLLQLFQNFLAPITENWLRLPKEASTAFVMGVVRRDFGAAGLFNLTLSPYQVTVAIITITLFVPCIASFMVMLNERGWKEGLIVWISAWVLGFTVGGIVAQTFSLFHLI
ncbi:MAG: ferrous iron transport protein B [Ignavibacterium sp.]